MKVIIMIDADNFRIGFDNSIKNQCSKRYLNFYKLKEFIMNYLKQNLQYSNCNLIHFRTYYYTGVYTLDLISRMEDKYARLKEEVIKKELAEKINKAKKSKHIQHDFLKKAKNYYFFEIRHKPLQFSPATLKVFQKGVDVQIAVDMVEFAYKNTFDIAVLLSGDIDLIESVKTIKNLGKHLVIFGDESVTSEEMCRESDLFMNLSRFNIKDLDKISHRPEKAQT